MHTVHVFFNQACAGARGHYLITFESQRTKSNGYRRRRVLTIVEEIWLNVCTKAVLVELWPSVL